MCCMGGQASSVRMIWLWCANGISLQGFEHGAAFPHTLSARFRDAAARPEDESVTFPGARLAHLDAESASLGEELRTMFQQKRRRVAEQPAIAIQDDASNQFFYLLAFDAYIVAVVARGLTVKTSANAGREFGGRLTHVSNVCVSGNSKAYLRSRARLRL